MIKKSFPIRLVKWFFVWSAVWLSLGLAGVLTGFSLFFDEVSLTPVFGFFIGFFLSTALSAVLYIHVLSLIGRVIEKVKTIAMGGKPPDDRDSFTKEVGELYELHKNLNKINNKLRWQKKIISQESSELEAVISAVRGAILAVNENQKMLFFNRQATLLFEHNKKPKKK